MKSMVKGEKTKIEDLGLSGKLEVGVSCGMAGATPDISCFGVDADGKLSDDRYFIFYNQLSSPEKAIEMKSGVGGFDKTFLVDLQALPPKIVRLVFVATLDGNATFADLSAGRLELLGPG
ncbi:MAG: TerD family protein, partial [Deltaproteobacteria bacterium]|nr:TerD family protein [Deltaproteobacteria bacterium]